MVCDILGLCCIVNCSVCMFLLWLPYGVINYNNIIIYTYRRLSWGFSSSLAKCGLSAQQRAACRERLAGACWATQPTVRWSPRRAWTRYWREVADDQCYSAPANLPRRRRVAIASANPPLQSTSQHRSYEINENQNDSAQLTPSTPAARNCCCSKDSAPYWSNPPFLIFDILALWRSGLSARAPECQKLKMAG